MYRDRLSLPPPGLDNLGQPQWVSPRVGAAWLGQAAPCSAEPPNQAESKMRRLIAARSARHDLAAHLAFRFVSLVFLLFLIIFVVGAVFCGFRVRGSPTVDRA